LYAADSANQRSLSTPVVSLAGHGPIVARLFQLISSAQVQVLVSQFLSLVQQVLMYPASPDVTVPASLDFSVTRLFQQVMMFLSLFQQVLTH